MDEVERWLKRMAKKGPFYVVSEKEITYHSGFDQDMKPTHARGKRYVVVWKQSDGKVRIGTLQDGLWVRYGIGTWATLTGDTPSGLWQIRPGVVTDEELGHMISVARDECRLPVFDLGSLRGLKH